MNSWPTPEEVERIASKAEDLPQTAERYLRQFARLLRLMEAQKCGMVDLLGNDPVYVIDGNRYVKSSAFDKLHDLARHLEQLLSVARKEAAREERERCAAFVQHRGQCAVQMINADERIDEKKSYAWDAWQHAIAIRTLSDAAGGGMTKTANGGADV